MTTVVLIAAVDRNLAIGKGGEMPWHLPADLAFFKRTTLGASVIMGRKTFESIGRPLPGRENIVITRNSTWQHPGCHRASGVSDAVGVAKSDPVFIIGGGEIYVQAMPQADRLIITHVAVDIDGADTFFPRIDETLWTIACQTHYEADERNPYSMVFTGYEKKSHP